MKNKNNKFKEFESIGLIAFTVAVSIASASITTSVFSNIQSNLDTKNLQEIQICENYVNNVIKKIEDPSIINYQYVDKKYAAKVIEKEKNLKAELTKLKPEIVNCNISEIRTKFIDDTNKVNEENTRKFSI